MCMSMSVQWKIKFTCFLLYTCILHVRGIKVYNVSSMLQILIVIYDVSIREL